MGLRNLFPPDCFIILLKNLYSKNYFKHILLATINNIKIEKEIIDNITLKDPTNSQQTMVPNILSISYQSIFYVVVRLSKRQSQKYKEMEQIHAALQGLMENRMVTILQIILDGF